MLNTSDKKYIKQTIQLVQAPLGKRVVGLNKKMINLDKKYDRKTKQLDDKIEDLRNDMADQFLINNQEHHTILQELKEFKNKSYEFFDQILGELKAMRENYTICSHRRRENGERLDLLEPRVKTMEGHLLLTDVIKD
jgi:polyhydroxyalkanoate synthesis regulator phasin